MYFWEIVSKYDILVTDPENCVIVVWNGGLTFNIYHSTRGDSWTEMEVRSAMQAPLTRGEARKLAVSFLKEYVNGKNHSR